MTMTMMTAGQFGRIKHKNRFVHTFVLDIPVIKLGGGGEVTSAGGSANKNEPLFRSPDPLHTNHGINRRPQQQANK
jgi:hypothetical protein